MRTSSGVARINIDVINALMQLDLPAPVAPATRMKCPVSRTLGGKIFPISVALDASLDLGLLELECGDPDLDMIRERRRASARERARGAF